MCRSSARSIASLYLSFAEIAHVRLEPNGVSLTTGAGVVVMLPVAAATYRGTLAASDDPLLARRNELHDWIRHARRRYQDAPRPPPMEDLDRGERSLEAWRRDLRRLSAGASPIAAPRSRSTSSGASSRIPTRRRHGGSPRPS